MNRRTAIVGRAFGIGAGLSYGISIVLIRQGVGDMTVPLVGAAVAMISGSFGLFIIGGRGIKSGVQGGKKTILMLLLSGVASACGIIASFFALSLAPVVIVGPLQNTTPLFTLLWSGLFLGQLEKITLRLILGAAFVVGGVILITMGRP